jgi:hypothetical protein
MTKEVEIIIQQTTVGEAIRAIAVRRFTLKLFSR